MNHAPTLEKYVMLRDNSVREIDSFILQDGYLFRFRKLYIPRTSLGVSLSWEIHAEGLAGHFGQNKSRKDVEHRFYWLSLKKDVAAIVGHVARVNGQITKTDCRALHSSPCVQLPLARRT